MELDRKLTFLLSDADPKYRSGPVGEPDHVECLILLWSGQIFGQTFRATGLIPVLLDSFGSISPASDRQGRALTMITLLSGFVALSTFTRSILLPSPLLPNLASMASRQRPAISSTPPGASPRSSSRSMAPTRSWASAFWNAEARLSSGFVSLGNIAGIVLFTQLWPQYHELTLVAGGLIALPLLTPL